MAHTYNKTTWVNEQTPLNADNLNNIENGIKNNSQDIATLELASEKLDKSLKDIKIDLTTDRTNNTNFQTQVTKQLEDSTNFQSQITEQLEGVNYVTKFLTPIMKESNRVGYGEVGSMTLPIEGNTLDAQLTELLEASY